MNFEEQFYSHFETTEKIMESPVQCHARKSRKKIISSRLLIPPRLKKKKCKYKGGTKIIPSHCLSLPSSHKNSL